MDIVYAVVADAASVDQAGKLGIFGIFDRITVNRVPALHHGAHLVAWLEALGEEAGPHKVEVLFADDDGVLGFRLELDGEVPGGARPSQTIGISMVVALPPLPLPHPGQYSLDVFADGRHAANVVLTVLLEEAG